MLQLAANFFRCGYTLCVCVQYNTFNLMVQVPVWANVIIIARCLHGPNFPLWGLIQYQNTTTAFNAESFIYTTLVYYKLNVFALCLLIGSFFNPEQATLRDSRIKNPVQASSSWVGGAETETHNLLIVRPKSSNPRRCISEGFSGATDQTNRRIYCASRVDTESSFFSDERTPTQLSLSVQPPPSPRFPPAAALPVQLPSQRQTKRGVKCTCSDSREEMT